MLLWSKVSAAGPGGIRTSGRTIKRKLEHLVEVRSTRPVRTAFEIIDYFKCEISEKKFAKLRGQNIQNKENSLELSRSDTDRLRVNSQE